MFGYPISLDVTGKPAVVIGPMAVAQGKAEALADAGARVTVVAEGPEERLARLQAAGMRVHRRGYEPGDLDDAFLCVAASPDPQVREAVFREARTRGVLVNVMDDVPRCDFAAPAVVRRGRLTIAISTGGRSPALARRLREQLAEAFGPEWEEALDLLGDVRDETLRALPDVGERSRRWSDALDLDELLTLVRGGRRDEARRRLVRRLLPEASA